MIISALAVGGVHAALIGQSHSRSILRTGFTYAVVLFAAITLLLGPNLRPFLDTVLIGHQARELATHLVITLPLGYGVGLIVVRSRFGEPETGGAGLAAIPKASWGAIGAVGIIGLFLTVGFLVTEAHGHGQSSNMTSLVLVHVFEHLLTYIFTPLLVAVFCATLRSPTR